MSAGKEKIDKSRRRFLKLGAVAGAGLVVGGYFTLGGEKVKTPLEVWDHVPEGWAPNAWLRIDAQGIITVRVNHTEMGQGISTALPMIVAEELDANWSQVRFEMAPVESVYKNPAFGTQMTGGSTSVRTSWEIMRRAGALARSLLVTAAAAKWNVPPEKCRTSQGRVIHPEGKQSLDYGQLVSLAARLELPKQVQLKEESQFRLIGQSLPRLDSADKTTGKAVFGIDVNRPGMLNATVIHPPVFGDRLTGYNAKPALSRPGVKAVFPISGGLAVVAETFWQALQAARGIEVKWDSWGQTGLDSEELFQHWTQLGREEGKAVLKTGEPKNAWPDCAEVIEAAYKLPFQAHATPEPMNCTAQVQPDACEVWAPTQNQDTARETAAKLSGLPYKAVKVHTTYAGGGFGRRINVDYVQEAVEISQKIGAPVKVTWSREEDMQHDFYRPAALILLKVGLDESGNPLVWRHRLVGPDHMAQMLPKLIPGMIPYGLPRGARNLGTWLAERIMPLVIPGKKACEGADHIPYKVDHLLVEHVNHDPGVPLGFWRSVANSLNVFAVESFVDELAAAAGMDPLQYRLQNFSQDNVLKNTLEKAAELAAWSKPRTSGQGMGLGLYDFHGTKVACVAQVSLETPGKIRVPQVVCAVDCGRVINPRLARAQVRGGLVFGLTAALKSAVTLKQGRVQQSNFHDFPILRMDEMPRIDVHLMPSKRSPQGLGEAGVPVIAPALANAIFAASGVRVRQLPLTPELLV